MKKITFAHLDAAMRIIHDPAGALPGAPADDDAEELRTEPEAVPGEARAGERPGREKQETGREPRHAVR